MRPTRTRSSRSRARSTRGVLLPLLMGGVLLYAVCLGLFALTHYDGGDRPAAGQVVHDFHAFLGVGPSKAQAAPTVRPAPARARPAPPPPAPILAVERSPLDRVAETLRRVERDAPRLKEHARDASFEPARVEVLSTLCEARDVLNGILDERPDDVRANGLWDQLQALLVAVRKL